MRSLVVALGLLLFAAAPIDAKPRSKTKSAAVHKGKRAKTSSAKSRHAKGKRGAKRGGKRITKGKKRIGHASKRRRFEMPRGPITGQSLGAPWAGRLHDAAELAPGDGYYIRRPWRAFGTTPMVDMLQRIVTDVADRFYDTHAIAIGDLSAETGGYITDHSSHQSGRDVDVGLIFRQKPANYPLSFVDGNAENLDLEATFVLVEEFAKTIGEPGGVQIIFLDYKVQGLLYKWALENGESEDYLAKLFQFPHGRGESMGIVRHEPNHADHLHVRFRCPPGDELCR